MPYRLSTFFWGGTLLLPTSVLRIVRGITIKNLAPPERPKITNLNEALGCSFLSRFLIEPGSPYIFMAIMYSAPLNKVLRRIVVEQLNVAKNIEILAMNKALSIWMTILWHPDIRRIAQYNIFGIEFLWFERLYTIESQTGKHITI